MDVEFKNWLQDRKLTQKTLQVLVKEEIISAEVISHLREQDLQLLKTQHSLSMGQIIELREARDALLRGEFIPTRHREPSEEPGQHSEKPGQHSEEPGQHSEEPGQPSEEPGQHSKEPGQHSEKPSQPSEKPSQPSEKPGQHSVEDSTAHTETTNAILQDCGEPSHTCTPEAVNELRNKLIKADKLQKQGHTDEAGKYTQEVVEGAQSHVERIITQTRPELDPAKLGNIAEITDDFKAGGHSNRTNTSSWYLCCCLL